MISDPSDALLVHFSASISGIEDELGLELTTITPFYIPKKNLWGIEVASASYSSGNIMIDHSIIDNNDPRIIREAVKAIIREKIFKI